jgi:hypothetical protein
VKIPPIIWKVPVVAAALLAGLLGASQAGWSGAELVVNAPLMGPSEDFITGIFFSIGAAVSVGSVMVVQRFARPARWIMVPILLYVALVPGAWNGFAGDFDATRVEAIRHHFANAYALNHMSERGRYRSCKDERIELTDDAKGVCAQALNAAPGEPIPGSEHRCGLLRMFGCVDTASESGR